MYFDRGKQRTWGPAVMHVHGHNGLKIALFKYSSSYGGNYTPIMLMCVLFNVLL